MTGQYNPDVYRPLSAADNDHVNSIDAEVADAVAALGELREAFLSQEAQFANKLGRLREEREILLGVFSRTYLNELEGPWVYDESARGFTKQTLTPGAKHNGTSHDHEQPVQQ